MNRKESLPEKIGNIRLDYTWYDDNDKYSDGDEVEDFILDVIKNKKPVRDILCRDKRWPVLYHLTPGRTVIVEPMQIERNDNVLEIGAGMGALTGALADRAKKVDCIELSLKRSMVNAYRNDQYNNINIIVGNFEKIEFKEKYNVVTLIGVLEYAGLYIHNSSDPARELLNRIRDLMIEEGRLYIAIENRLGMKYFAGCAEDHFANSYVGIEGYFPNSRIRTYSKAELSDLLRQSGFDDFEFYYPMPDYKLPSVIYSEKSLNVSAIPPVANYDLHRFRVFDEQRAIQAVSREEFGVFANSFLVEVKKHEKGNICEGK